MSGFLLDVNVLIAMAWPTHVSHRTVHRWLARNANDGWATCPMTECAFVRLTSNPSFSAQALSPKDSIALLNANLSHPAHIFWPDDLSIAAALDGLSLRGHQQITDVYLLGLARRHKGKFATLDSGLVSLARNSKYEIELIR